MDETRSNEEQSSLERLDQLRRHLPEVMSSHIQQLESGTFEEANMVKVISLTKEAFKSEICDQIFRADLSTIMPFLTLMIKQLAEPSLKVLYAPIIDNLMRLFRFVKRRNVPGIRYVFCDLLGCISEVSQYVQSGAHYAAEQAGLQVQICMFPSFCQFIACHSFNCQSLADFHLGSCQSVPFQCQIHPASNPLVVNINTIKRIELFHASCTTIAGQMIADHMYLHDLAYELASLLSKQIIGFSCEVQEATVGALVQYVKHTRSHEIFPVIKVLELISTDCFRTATLEAEVTTLLDLTRKQLDFHYIRPIALDILTFCQAAFEVAHTSGLRTSLIRFVSELFRIFPYLRLYVDMFKPFFTNPDLLKSLCPLLILVLESLPETFLSPSLALNATPEIFHDRPESNVFVINASWSFFHELVRGALQSLPSKFASPTIEACNAFSSIASVFSCFARRKDYGLLAQLTSLVNDWLQAISDFCTRSSSDAFAMQTANLLLSAFQLMSSSFRYLEPTSFQVLYQSCFLLIQIPFSASEESLKSDSILSSCVHAWSNLPFAINDQLEMDLVMPHLGLLIPRIPFIMFRISSEHNIRSKHIITVINELQSSRIQPPDAIQVVRCIGVLCCILSESCTLESQPGDDPLDAFMKCRLCDYPTSNRDALQELKFPPWTLCSYFLRYLNPEHDIEVRAEMCQQLFRILCHSDRDQLRCAAPLLRSLLVDLLFDARSEIRTATAQSIHLLVSGDQETCALVALCGPTKHDATRRSNPILHSIRFLVEKLVEANEVHSDERHNDNIMDKFKDVISALSSVAKYLTGTAQSVIVFVLIQQMMHDDVSLRAQAYKQICDIALHCRIPVADLIQQPYVEECLLLWMPERPLVCDEVCEAFLGISVCDFLHCCLPRALPGLILKHSEEALHEIGLRLGESVRSFVMERISPILLRILLDSDPEEGRAASAIAFLSEKVVPGFRFSELLKQSKTLLLEKLIDAMGIPNQCENAKYALRILVLADSGSAFSDYVAEKVDVTVNDNQMSLFCSEYFLMMSDYLCQFIQGSNHTVERKLQAIRSLDCLCHLVGNRVYNFSSKLIATVKLTLERSGSDTIRVAALKIFEAFIELLSTDQLSTCLSQLVVTLLSCWHSNTNAIIRQIITTILESLLIKKRHALSECFNDIPMIPDDSSLHHIKTSVEAFASGCSVVKKLDNLIRLMDHPSANVREMAASQLRILLLHYENDIHALVLTNDTQLKQLVVTLMHRCSDPSEEVRLLSAECIGVLGALDPAQIGYVNVRNEPAAISTADDFAVTLCVDYLINAIRSLPPADQNRSMFALQEILKFVGCRPETPNFARNTSQHTELPESDRRAVAFWSKIPVELRDVAVPCLISNFVIPSRKSSSNDGHVFWRQEITYERWLAEWTRFLIANSKGPLKPIFDACQGVVVSDLTTARFLLPHLVLAILMTGDRTGIEQIRKEIFTILDHAIAEGPRPVRSEQSSLQTVFDLLDLLRKGCDSQRNRMLPIAFKKLRCFEYATYPCVEVQELLDSIPHMILARAAHACGATARALRHFEQHIRQTDAILTSQHLEFLQSLFCDLDDTDSMKSIPALRTEPATPSEQGRDYESLGQWNMALICYQEECRSHLDNHNARARLLHSMFKLGQYENCIAHARRFLEEGTAPVPLFQGRILSLGIEAAWRIADWEALQHLIQHHPDQSSFEVGLGRVFLSWKHHNHAEIDSALRSTRVGVMGKLAAASQESYSRAYPLWVQLQLLHSFTTTLGHVSARSSWDWFRYVTNMQPKFSVRESQLSMLRTIFELSGWPELAGRCWLQIAREARRSGELEQASYAALRAQRLQIRNSGIEQAKILRAQGLLHQALNVLEEHSNVDTSIVADSLSADRQVELCNMACLVGQYMQESASRTSNMVLTCYRKAISQFPNSSRAHFLLASYSDMVLRSALNEPDLTDNKRHCQIREQAPQIIRHYIAAVREKSTCVFESMPRIITLFCELAPIARTNSRSTDDPERIAKDAVNAIPAQHWFITLPQIISRLQNDNLIIQNFLKSILIKTVLTYPRQTAWLVATIANFKNEKRKQAIVMVISSVVKQMTPKRGEELTQAQRLLRLLIEICTAPVNETTKTMKFPSSLRRYLRATPPCLIMPLQATLTVAIPEPVDQDGDLCASGTAVDMKPFCEEPAMLQSIDEAVQVLNSKEKPRKAAFIDTNGNRHWFLCKIEGEGDMRKNSRMMDFAAVLNRLFRCFPQARQRQLRLRTFAVLPLREDCGIIEWIPDTIALRHLLEHYQHDQQFKNRELFKFYTESTRPAAIRYQQMLERSSPLLHRFFLDKFPDPNCWYESRLVFTRSWAAWCIVGHILGLGDRHCENILIDHNTGETVHVDFDCLFDRGLNLRHPEVVPFRLTQNALDGMGITKYEGAFRSCCHIVLNVLRTHHETVKNCLETFVHDPLVEWIGPHSSVGARKAMNDIEKRLAGRIGDSILTVTIEGYVEHLIQQATSPDNLGRMFVGWAPWM